MPDGADGVEGGEDDGGGDDAEPDAGSTRCVFRRCGWGDASGGEADDHAHEEKMDHNFEAAGGEENAGDARPERAGEIRLVKVAEDEDGHGGEEAGENGGGEEAVFGGRGGDVVEPAEVGHGEMRGVGEAEAEPGGGDAEEGDDESEEEGLGDGRRRGGGGEDGGNEGECAEDAEAGEESEAGADGRIRGGRGHVWGSYHAL